MSDRGPIVNLESVPLEKNIAPDGESGFASRSAAIGAALGTEKLGCRLLVVPPGKAAYPYHLHHAHEELFVVLAGEGTLRYAGERYTIGPGDVISAKAGAEHPHQIVNTSDADLRYLAISTMEQPEVCEYPDSGKVAAIAGAPPGRRPYPLFFVARRADGVDYWDGEE